MVMDSNSITAMLQQQNAMFAGLASYSQQITPPMGGAPGMGAGVMSQAYMGPQAMSFNQGPAPMAAPMPISTSWHPGMMGGMAMPFGPPSSGGAQAMGESIAGSAFAGMASGTQGLGMMSGLAGVGATGMGLLGLGGTSLGMGMAAFGSTPVTLGLGAAAHASSNMYQGFQQRQAVNQVLRSNFGNVQGIGGGRGGMGFSSGEMGGISSMLREMGTEDLTTNMNELTQLMDKTAGMGLYRGVQSAREFKQKFQTTVDSLKEIAQIMHTTLDGAASMMSQQKGMGFFTGQDISKQLAATRVMSSMTGMSIDQTTQLAQQGAQFARATGGRGRQGAQAGLMAGGRIAMAQSMGILDEDAMDFATGGLQGAEAAAALSSRMQQTSMRFMSRGAGRAMVAGLWDAESGGINQERLNAVMSGSMNIRELRNQGRRSIRETGGRRSEFFRDEEQLRSQVLAQGGEYLPMAVYGTHLANKRGLGMDDPIVQRSMRRKFRMSQGEVEAATEMMQNMPQIQAQMLMKGRGIRDLERSGTGKELRGIQGLGKRLGQMWEKSVENPFRQFSDELTGDISRGIEGMVDTMQGRIEAKMSGAARQLIAERSEFGRAVSKEARSAASFSQDDFNKFMQLTPSNNYKMKQNLTRDLGAMLGMRPDNTGGGQRMYEGAFDVMGGALSDSLRWTMGNLSGVHMPESGDVNQGDFSFGLRSLAKEWGIEGSINKARGYDPSHMTREGRAKALGFQGGDANDLKQFLSTAQVQMKRDLGYDRATQKRLGTEYRELLNNRLQHSKDREQWSNSYVRGFGGVTNVLQHTERQASPELRAVIQKAKKSGSKADLVGLVSMLEEGGDVVKGLRVTDELKKVMGEDWRSYEETMDHVKGVRADAFEGIAGLTADDYDMNELNWAEKALVGTGAIAGGFARGVSDMMFNMDPNANNAVIFAEGHEKRSNQIFKAGSKFFSDDSDAISSKELETFFSDSDASEAFKKWQATGSLQSMNKFQERAGSTQADVARRLMNVDKTKGSKGKKYLSQIYESMKAEDYAGRRQIHNDLGKQLSGALESATSRGMSKEGGEAFGRLQEVARLRSSNNPDDIKKSYEEERDLMNDIIGTEQSKELIGALTGQEGAEFVLSGLQASEHYYQQFGGGKGRGNRGERISRKHMKNIIKTTLGTAGLKLDSASILEMFGEDGKKGRQRDVIDELMKGGPSSETAIKKILVGAEMGGVKGSDIETLKERFSTVGTVIEDKLGSDEEIRKISGGLGANVAASERAKGRTAKVATSDLQETANKHLATMEKAILLMASKEVETKDIDMTALQDAVKKGVIAGSQ